MRVSHLRELLTEARLSPEQFGQRIELSGMTLRRFLKKPDDTELDEFYDSQIRRGVYGLIIDGKIKPDAISVERVLSASPNLSFEAAIRSLGFPQDSMAKGGSYPDQVLIGLSEIGASPRRQSSVQASGKVLSRFRKMGVDWANRVNTLAKVVRSRKLSQMEKLTAYGALFYLITTFDLIPDTIPVFGVLDDFAILGIVAAYYVRKFPELFEGGSPQ
jgi:uncharacterized membrane protein YkvA (DUF1232 family)